MVINIDNDTRILLVFVLSLINFYRILETFVYPKASGGHKKQSASLLYMVLAYVAIMVTILLNIHTKTSLNLGISLVGAFIFSAGLIVRTWAIVTLGEFHNPHIKLYKHHKLIQEGLYKHIRHPIHSGIILEIIGVPLMFNSHWALFVSFVFYIPALIYRTIEEERVLERHFKKDFVEYKKKTSLFFPGIM